MGDASRERQAKPSDEGFPRRPKITAHTWRANAGEATLVYVKNSEETSF